MRARLGDAQTTGTDRGRSCVLYRMRLDRLRVLAWRLETAGFTTRVSTPDVAPVLRVRRPAAADLDIVAIFSTGDVDWFRYRRAGRDIAPVARVEEAAGLVTARLRPAGATPPALTASRW